MKKRDSEETIHREMDRDAENPSIEVVRAISDIEGRDATELTAIHDCIDGMLEHLFSTPPSPDAEVEVQFSYESYRVTVEQNGHAEFVKEE